MVFNDPDEDEYESSEDEAFELLGEELHSSYWIFRNIAQGDVSVFLRLYNETPRLEVIKALAFKMTYHKERKRMERRIYGR